MPSFISAALDRVFQGDISPLSSKEVIEACVMPVLLYGSENWVLTDVLMERGWVFRCTLLENCSKFLRAIFAQSLKATL